MTRRLKILSYNIHKGFTMYNRKFVLSRIRDAIREAHPDIVFLQEVLGRHEIHRHRIIDWPEQAQFEFLADEIWPHYAYGKNAVYTSGHHGNAILSKYPFTFWENLDVSTNSMEKRGILHGVIEAPGFGRVHTLCVHLGLLEADRAKQISTLCDRINSHIPSDEALVIAGDFNDWRVKATRQMNRRIEVQEAFQQTQGRHARTFPSWMPALRLDRVYFRGLQAHRAKSLVGKPWNDLSDHLALWVEFLPN